MTRADEGPRGESSVRKDSSALHPVRSNVERERRSDLLKRLALEEGFDLAGICPPDPSEHMGFLEGWLEAGLHGEMAYLARTDARMRRADLRQTMPGVRAVLVVAHGYDQEDPAGVPEDPSRGVIARYARGRDYHRVVKKGLLGVHRRFCEAEGVDVPARAYVDTGPILERELGRRAGLGWFGRNTMLLHPRRGSYFFLGALLLEVDAAFDEPFAGDHCGSCRACLDACPTGALLGRDEAGAPVMDATRCISYLTIENTGPIPHELRPLIGNRIYGCDICQEVCPFSIRFSEPSTEPSYAVRGPGESPVGVETDPTAPSGWHPGTESPSLMDLFGTALSEDSWESFSRGSAIRRAGREGFARNVAVALGNWGDASAAPVLMQGLKDPHPLVRAHAAWALGRVGSAEAQQSLREGLLDEQDPVVREEMERALAASSPSLK